MNNRIVNVVMKRTQSHKHKWAHTACHSDARHAKLLVISLFWVNNMQIVHAFMAGTVIVCVCLHFGAYAAGGRRDALLNKLTNTAQSNCSRQSATAFNAFHWIRNSFDTCRMCVSNGSASDKCAIALTMTSFHGASLMWNVWNGLHPFALAVFASFRCNGMQNQSNETRFVIVIKHIMTREMFTMFRIVHEMHHNVINARHFACTMAP